MFSQAIRGWISGWRFQEYHDIQICHKQSKSICKLPAHVDRIEVHPRNISIQVWWLVQYCTIVGKSEMEYVEQHHYLAIIHMHKENPIYFTWVSHRLPMIFHTSSYLGEHLPLRAWASSWWRRADPESSPVRHPENVKVGFLLGPETYYWGLGVGPGAGPETCGGGTGNGTGKLLQGPRLLHPECAS